MISDFIFIFSWWFLIFSLGVVFLPLTFYFLGNFFDKGYAFSKIIGILLVSYLTWLLGSLKILPFSSFGVWGIVVFLALLNIVFNKLQKNHLKKLFKVHWRIFVFEEVLFLICLSAWSFIRGFQPDIQGLEKFMDFGFVNSILSSRFFPPSDMWLAGKTINYYYFGHLVSAVLTKLSGISSNISYNLMIATLFGLIFTGSFCLGANFIHALKKQTKWVLFGGLSTAFFLTLGGNLQPLWFFFSHKLSFANYWYPDATRFIVEQFGAADNTIHEFPLYSFVVSDLHGHLLNLPFVLLFLGLVFSFYRQKQLKISYLFFLSLLLGVFYMTNAWDLPIYLLFLGLVLLAIKTFYQSLIWGIVSLLLAILFSLPFHFHFKSIVGGLGLTDFHSPPWMLLVLWGFPLFLTLAFAAFFKLKMMHKKRKSEKLNKVDLFVFLLLGLAWFLISMPEFIYLKDIYIHSYQRANTMFKLTYQSFVMFGLVGSYIFIRISTGLKKKFLKYGFLLVFLFFSFFIFAYPYFAVKSYYGLKNYRGLDGLSYLQNLYPNDYQALLWLRNIPNQPVIVEAVGESYTDYARVSANTGLPTILGWRVHEWLWRGGFEEPGKRTEEVKTIYESSDLSQTQKLLQQYQAEYLFLGTLERQAYPELKEAKFYQLGKVVFSSNQTKVFQLDF